MTSSSGTVGYLKSRAKQTNDDDNIDALLAEAESIKDNADAYLPEAAPLAYA